MLNTEVNMHGKLYKQLMNSREWRRLRARKLQANPLCEEHLKEGKYVAASVVHHIVEVESGHTEAECRALAFSWNNLEALCRECHAAIHKSCGYHTKAAHKKREADRLEQWKSRLRPTPTPPVQEGRMNTEINSMTKRKPKANER